MHKKGEKYGTRRKIGTYLNKKFVGNKKFKYRRIDQVFVTNSNNISKIGNFAHFSMEVPLLNNKVS